MALALPVWANKQAGPFTVRQLYARHEVPEDIHCGMCRNVVGNFLFIVDIKLQVYRFFEAAVNPDKI